MPHIHELIDYVANVYIVYRHKVLLVDHRQHNLWLPVGGHIELDEDPEQALYREIKEECGLEVEIHGQKPDITVPGVKPLPTPSFMDIHEVTPTHRHIALIYFGKAKNDEAKLSEEHHEVRWFAKQQLTNGEEDIRSDIIFYAQQALQQLGTTE